MSFRFRLLEANKQLRETTRDETYKYVSNIIICFIVTKLIRKFTIEPWESKQLKWKLSDITQAQKKKSICHGNFVDIADAIVSVGSSYSELFLSATIAIWAHFFLCAINSVWPIWIKKSSLKIEIVCFSHRFWHSLALNTFTWMWLSAASL